MGDLIDVMKVSADEEKAFEEVVVRVTRTAKVVSGGKRLSFTALAVIGNRNGKVGWGYGKAQEVPFAVEKAIRNAKKNVISIPMAEGATLPHTVECKFKSTVVRLVPASRGTGLKAGASVRAVLEYAGIKNALSKVYGSSNPMNAVKATFEALRSLRSKEQVEELRGVTITGAVPRPISEVPKREKKQVVLPQEDKAAKERLERRRARVERPRKGRGGPGGQRRGPGGYRGTPKEQAPHQPPQQPTTTEQQPPQAEKPGSEEKKSE